METSWDEAVQELEQAHARLLAAAPDHFQAVERALMDRLYAISVISELAAKVNTGTAAPGPELLQRLSRVLETGGSVAEKLGLTREQARSEVARLNQLGLTLRAMGSEPQREPGQVDCRG